MITQIHRFHGHAVLPALYRRGQTFRGASVSLKINPRTSSQPYRLAVIVGRKVNTSAVIRNRIRRRIYEVIRTEVAPKLGSFDIAIIVYTDSIQSLPRPVLAAQLIELLGKASAYSANEHAIVNVTGK